jgi:hypothetical protein
MDQFALLPASEKIAYLEAAAANHGIAPDVVEKDFWVCWVLKQIFQLEGIGAHLTFKGGTSLSKCYNAIQRFSEDIDIAIERKYLEHGKNIQPSLDESNKENKRRIEELMALAQAAIHQQILPQLRQRIGEVLGHKGGWSIGPDPDDALGQTLLFVFPAAVTKSVNEYIKPAVKIELGARADHWPAESVEIAPYVGGVLRDALAVQPVTVKVLSAERTFWEKAMILHRLYHSPDEKAISRRMSRHYYDLYAMEQVGIFEKAIQQDTLMKSVVDFNRLFFRYSWLNYDEAKRGSFRLVPKGEERLQSLKTDYRLMSPMFFQDPPTFDQIVIGLQKMEERINRV